jgi:hypothetical protein
MVALVAATAQEADPRPNSDIPYGIAVEPWPEAYGKHRARIRVEQETAAVRVHLPWRRRDRDAARKRVLLVDAATGKELANVARLRIERDSGDLAFEPATVPGEYHVYYLPYRVQDGWGGYGGDYLPAESTADPAWLDRHGLSPAALASGAWESLPEAKVLEFQARTAFNSFYPMEVVASAAEVAALVEAHQGAAYLVFAEDRDHPIWMPDDLPLRWVRRGPQRSFACEASRHEFRVFQVGLYATARDLADVRVEFSDLRSARGDSIPAAAMRCLNLGGTNWDGSTFRTRVEVQPGRVQALWCGIQVPREANPGEYTGSVTIRPANAPATALALELTVADQVLEDGGDGEPWRLSRLRWLDSTIALDDEVVRPYTPLRLQGQTVSCLGRAVTFGPGALPTSIRCGEREVLAAPVRLVIETAAGAADLAGGAPELVSQAPGAMAWKAETAAASVAVLSTARMEFDGHILFRVTLTAKESVDARDIRLDIPFRRDVATYLMGAGRQGGTRPREWSWKWGGAVYYDSFWIGDVTAGLQCELRGASYCGPMVNLYWHLGQLTPPVAWDNGGQGGVSFSEAGDLVLARAYSGPRALSAGDKLSVEFAFLVTPVKPLDTAAHFRTRYFHDYQPVERVAATGANVVNIHHGNELNPYINYPFMATEKLGGYVREAHARNLKVKLYYTLRELTNHVPEMPALRSLGHEVLAPGNGGGYPWLREHLGGDYAPSWYQQQPDGEACASIVNSGLSRWYNYYLEGLNWLVQNLQIDGLYNDDVSYDRQIMKRVRKILDRQRPGCQLDLHSNTAFSHGPANQYMEFFPYVDRLWFGEGFNYNSPPDYWLTEISGIPYGLMGEMLQDGGNPWRGMVYGMTVRLPWCGDPRPLWKLWDEVGIEGATMRGYWDLTCPVRTGREDVLATAYVQPGRTLVSLASWARRVVRVDLAVDWQALGLDAARASLYAPAVADFQEEALFRPGEALPVLPGRGWLLVLDHTVREGKPYVLTVPDVYAGRIPVFEDAFAGTALPSGWQTALSAKPGTALAVEDGWVTLSGLAHSHAMLRRALPEGVTLVQCRVRTGTDGGMTWGPGIGLRWPGRLLRLNLRTVEGRLGIDDGIMQRFFAAGVQPNSDYWLRLRLDPDWIYAEYSEDGEWWVTAGSMPRAQYPNPPTELLLGKMAGDGSAADADAAVNPQGTCALGEVRILR